nr:immunoglobulin heavy chain junction region [Macaca mulatta]MOV53514.1 immunoglobulin heavy chain junction region [Macaca mulatta]MOV53727.1 immunoglobulin heavy chain junction region [Macaca mulatta]MOV53797.1 immunoglobulin heavy chain junction region [Macaca mulatta]MOV53866.1 immunoglobulin heavy chain junction region [Macaca mulatta]
CATSHPYCRGIFCFVNYGLDSW